LAFKCQNKNVAINGSQSDDDFYVIQKGLPIVEKFWAEHPVTLKQDLKFVGDQSAADKAVQSLTLEIHRNQLVGDSRGVGVLTFKGQKQILDCETRYASDEDEFDSKGLSDWAAKFNN
jgi:hypothetical protein